MKNMENKPTHYVYHIIERTQDASDEKTGFWTKIGAAWPHKDGKGFTVSIDAIPLNGRLILREPQQEEQPVAAEATEEKEPAPVAA